LITSGLAVGTSLLLFPFILTVKGRTETQAQMSFLLPAGLALSVGLSVFLRTLDLSLDYSLTPSGAWAGWLLGLALASSLTRLKWQDAPAGESSSKGITAPLLGIFLVITLVYFIFSAPAVLARWTEGNYGVIIGLVSLLSLAAVFIFMDAPAMLDRISNSWLILWNILFMIFLAATILAQRVNFPLSPDSAPVVVHGSSWIQQLPLYLMLLLFPVIFLDLRLFFGQIHQANPSPRQFIPGLLLGSLALVVLVFVTIFTNVWGYIEPVSTPFRNLFWLPFLLITAAISLITWRSRSMPSVEPSQPAQKLSLAWPGELAVILAVTLFGAFVTPRVRPPDPGKTSLVVMTYNIQAGNDGQAQRSYERQLALIRKIDPDILALQETDTARISMNNDDYVRYFAGKLGYYSYYGPTTVTGTFGTAILSKYPLRDTRSVFTFSNTDEIGTAEAMIEVGGRLFSIHNVHPDGSAEAKMTFAQTLVSRAALEANVIALGDYNLREDQPAYLLVAAHYIDAWKSLHPAEKGEGKGWIDHIFISTNLRVKDPTYILPPESASDHPAHWAVIYWE
jgi:endonuclease/exonuclease/phosphatase family metal-dependent hydrolase